MVTFVRWTLFILIGYPFQLLVFLIYPVLHFIWKIFIYKNLNVQLLAYHEKIDPSLGKKINQCGLLENEDDHGAFTMFGAIHQEGLSALASSEGDLARRIGNFKKVSGDVVVAWFFAATAKNFQITCGPLFQELVLRVANNYLKHLGTRSYGEPVGAGWVSNRCNNFGLNYCPDSQAWFIGRPAAGPQFYTSSCVFAFASLYSFKFKVIFWLHWILMGGWYWAFSPLIYTQSKPIHYAKDITMKALWVHKVVFGDRWWIRKPMELIAVHMSHYRNDLWYAMLGCRPVLDLPEVMDAFFSQNADATSKMSPDLNGYLGQAIEDLVRLAVYIDEKSK